MINKLSKNIMKFFIIISSLLLAASKIRILSRFPLKTLKKTVCVISKKSI